MLIDRSGNEVGGTVGDTPFAARPDGIEMNVDELLAAVGRVLADLGPDRDRVAALGVAGLAESGAPLDAQDRPLAPVIAWHDPRGGEVVDTLERHFGDDLSDRIGRRIRTVSSVAKLGWAIASGVQGVRWWLGVPELCVHGLTGSRATDFSLAARTGAYDVGERRYIPEVIDALGFPPDVFAMPSPAGAVMGRVSGAGAQLSGLPRGIAVTIAGHDHLAGMVGSGAEPDDLVNSVGTAETVVGRAGRLPQMDQALALRAAVTVLPGGDGWAVLASGARSGLVLAAVAQALGRPLGELDDMASAHGSRTVEAGGLVAALEQHEEPAFPDGEPGQVWNGVLAALAARTQDAVDRLEKLCGPAKRLVVFGGGSRSRPWLAAKADLSRVPVFRSTAGEAVARGAAVYAGVADGWWASADKAPAPPLEPV